MALDYKFVPTKGVNIPPGSHVGLLAEIIHLGVQRGEYEGVVSYKDKVLFTFELPDITLDDGRPVRMSKVETNSSSNRSNYLKLVKALTGKQDLSEGIELDKLIGSPVLLQVEDNKKGTGSNIKVYMAVPAVIRTNLKPLMSEPRLLLDVEKIGDEIKKLPDWIQKMINSRISDSIPEIGNDSEDSPPVVY